MLRGVKVTGCEDPFSALKSFLRENVEDVAYPDCLRRDYVRRRRQGERSELGQGENYGCGS